MPGIQRSQLYVTRGPTAGRYVKPEKRIVELLSLRYGMRVADSAPVLAKHVVLGAPDETGKRSFRLQVNQDIYSGSFDAKLDELRSERTRAP